MKCHTFPYKKRATQPCSQKYLVTEEGKKFILKYWRTLKKIQSIPGNISRTVSLALNKLSKETAKFGMRPKSMDKQHSIGEELPGEKKLPEYQIVKRKSVNLLSEENSEKEQILKSIEQKSNHDFDVACDETVVVVENMWQNKINCRLCDKDITGKECQLLYDQEENVETRLGRKINIIINSTETQLNLSQYCCSVCSSKIEICFSLLVEIQASDEVIKQTYGHISNGMSVDTSTQLFICGECKSTITGIKAFIRHYENHILKKTVINSRSDVKVSQFLPQITSDAGNGYEEVTNILNGEECAEMVNNENTEVIYKFDNKKKKILKNMPGTNELYEKTDDVDNVNVVYGEVESEKHPCGESDHEAEDIGEAMNKEEDVEASESESSVSSDTSYKNLVDIVKRELEKSDSDDDTGVEITVDQEGNYYCSQCNLAFEYKFLFVHHVMKDHKWNGFDDESGSETIKAELDDDGYVNCPKCQEVFLPSEIEKHLEECPNDLTGAGNILCHACGKLCTLKQWQNHKKRHIAHAGMWACELCGKRFKAKRILRSHLGEHDESKKKVCEICGKKLLPLSFFSHMMKHKEKRHVCQYCGKGFTYNYGLKMHLKVHKGSDRLEAKPGKKKDRVFCWLCKKDFESSTALHRHLKTQHNIQGAQQDSRFACSECDKKFADMFGLKAHLKLIHEMKDEEISRFKSLPVYRYIECNVCNQVFNSENKVRIHMKQDHGLKPFEMEILKKECEKCGKRFASKQNLIHHINGAHLNIKPMQCDICNERFAKHSSLIYHKLRHSGEKPFQCEFCHKTYRQRNDVIRHLARHVRDQELTLEEASAINNSPSPLVLKRRIFLKDSSISYQALVSRNRRQKAEVVEVDPNPVVETKMEYDEGSLIYVEEVMADEIQQPESPSEVKFMTVKPVYNEERNTIILSSPELFRNAVENVSFRYITPHGKDLPAVIVKKEVEI